MRAMKCWLACIVMAAAWAGPAAAQVQVKKVGEGEWVIRNPQITVTLHGSPPCFDVQLRSGQRWTACGWREQRAYGVTIGRGRPKIDGTVAPGEWPGPAIGLGAKDLTDDSPPSSPSDFSAELYLAQDGRRLYIAARARDEAYHPSPGGEGRWWLWDSVEFWIGGQQYAARWGPGGPNVVAIGKGNVGGAEVAARRAAGGWEVEISVPLPQWAAERWQQGKPVPIAVGLNDSDTPGKRDSQLYFPRSWVHSAPETFAAATAGEKGSGPQVLAQPKSEIRQVRRIAGGLQFICPAVSGSGRPMFDCTVRLTLPRSGAELLIEVDRPGQRDERVERFRVLSPLRQAGPAEIYAAAYCNGIAVPDSERRFRGRWWVSYGSIDMPWVGYGTPGGAGYLLLFDTPDDGAVVLESVGFSERLVPVPYQLPSFQTLRYPRRIRYIFFDRGGFVAMCKWYRRYARRKGILRTLREKMRLRPQLERIAGAPDIWGGSPAFGRQARRAGIRHMIINGTWPAPEMEALKALGYLISKYDNYEDMLPGPREQYLHGKFPDDVVVKADGSLMKAWLTWDKKTQFMKRCSLLYLDVARIWIPRDLAEHPYNARFIDVTTACALRECYSKQHPCTRTGDREARQRLARYVAEELRLVLGGEHGRWWGVPFYDYWEGMQSGGFYSWPAGHVGINLPKRREDIGEMYLEYGIGEKRRVPLWELTFGDCEVSYWYWGDSTGHLYNVAPEIAARKDCWNLLWGTCPLYWVNRPFGFNWKKPELRRRLLESYFVTCLVHELVWDREMVDYRWLTEDRAVHQSRFAGGYTITVNFGEKPYVLETKAGRQVLPQFGFYAEGPGLQAKRVAVGGRTVTYIRTPHALYCDAGGQRHDFGMIATDGRVFVEFQGAAGGPELPAPRLVWIAGSAPEVRVANGPVLIYADDDALKPARQVARVEGRRARWPEAIRSGFIFAGPAARQADFAVEAAAPPESVLQGQPIALQVRVKSLTERGGRVPVEVYLDEVLPGRRLASVAASVPAGGSKQVEVPVPTAGFDGPHRLIVVVNRARAAQEITGANNRCLVRVVSVANPEGFAARLRLAISADRDAPGAAAVAPVRVPQGAGVEPERARLVRLGADGKPAAQPPAQLERAGGQWRLVAVDDFGPHPALYELLLPAASYRSLGPAPISWDEKAQRVTAETYEVGFDNGRITHLRILLPGAPEGSVVRHIATSGPEFGWSEERGTVRSIEAVAVGPARAVVRVVKSLDGGFEYTKTYCFYPRYFTVRADFNKRPAVWLRFGIPPGARYRDSEGNQAEVDGRGKGEGVSGRAHGVRWIAFEGAGWALGVVNTSSRPYNVSYWDQGSGDIGFTCSDVAGLEAAIVPYGPQRPADFAERDWKRLTARIRVELRGGGE